MVVRLARVCLAIHCIMVAVAVMDMVRFLVETAVVVVRVLAQEEPVEVADTLMVSRLV
jgi:hypothetical protein